MPDLQEPTPQQQIPPSKLALPPKPEGTDALRQIAMIRFVSGSRIPEIAKDLGVVPSTVWRWIRFSPVHEHIQHGRQRAAALIPKSCDVVERRINKGSETAALAVLRGTGVLRNEDKVDMRGAFLFATDLPQELLARYDAPGSENRSQDAPQDASTAPQSDECSPVEAVCLAEASTTGQHNGSYATGTSSQVLDNAQPTSNTQLSSIRTPPIATQGQPTSAPAKRRPGRPRKLRQDDAKS